MENSLTYEAQSFSNNLPEMIVNMKLLTFIKRLLAYLPDTVLSTWRVLTI